MATETTTEKRILRLEKMLLDLLGKIAGIVHKLGQVAEDNARAAQPLPNTGGLFRFQAKEEIAANTGAGLTSGKARTLQVIGDVRYKKDGDPEIDLYNDTDGDIGINSFGVGAIVNGKYTALVAWCDPSGLSAASDPPEG